MRFPSRILILAAILAIPLASAQPYPGKEWPKSKGTVRRAWSEEKLAAARAYSKTIATAAVVIVHDGELVSQWGEPARKFNVHSIRKSLLSAMYGIHAAQRHIDTGATLEKLGIDDNEPKLTDVEKKATVLDLLKARSGVYHPALYETPGMRAARPPRGSHPPGTFWYYNNWDFNVLGTIFEQLTRRKIAGEFDRLIARPLEMQDFQLTDMEYFRGDDSIHPAYPFRLTARDMARFGLLFLRDGKWRNKQIVPADWVRASVTSYSDAGARGGYGYMWWVAVNGRHLPNVQIPDGSYTARGAGGHFILVIPARKLVIVHRVNTDLRDNSVTDPQFGELVRLILEANAGNRG